VVATAAGGTVELMQDGITGVLVAPGDVPALTAGLLRALALPQRWSDWGAAGRARMQRDFSVEACARATAAVYRAILHAKGRAA
jgi:glycosyltransferase involved in cell wall biosynthesis